MVSNAKRNFYQGVISKCTSSKELFKSVNSLCGKTKDKILPSHTSLKELADRFGTFFIDKVSNIRRDLDSADAAPPSFEPFYGVPMNVFKPVSTDEVEKIILSSPPKSCCLDPIPTPLLVSHLKDVIEPVTLIINDSLRSGIVPQCFKHAAVTPLLKKPTLCPEELNNYRPLSNLPFISKILEKVVFSQIFPHLEINDLLEFFQSAYRPFHSTETALINIFNDLLCAADAGKVSVLTMLDLSAAFDTIDHSILLERLKTTFGLYFTCVII